MEKSGDPPPYTTEAPPQAGFVMSPQSQPLPPSANVTHVVVEAAPQMYGPDEQNATCPHCKHQIVTNTKTEPSTKTHIAALILCLIGCWFCFCLPYCIDSCQNKNHYCPNCNAYLGTYKS